MHSIRLWSIFAISISLFAIHSTAYDLELKFQWKTIDFDFGGAEKRQDAIDSRTYIPSNVIPVGLDIYKDRLFLSLPRLKKGVPASLAYINLTDADQKLKLPSDQRPANIPANDVTNAPLLQPYPNWAAHKTTNPNDVPDIVSPFHIRIDRCGRLWTIDTGIDGSIDILQEKQPKQLKDPQILIYNLTTDNIIHRYKLPEAMNSTIYSNIVIDDTSDDCNDAYAYVANAGSNKPHLIVYSLKQNDSWAVAHNFFHLDPLAGNFSVLGVNYQTSTGLYSLTLSKKKKDGFADLYFHALTSYHEFKVSTKILRDKEKIGQGKYYGEFTEVGKRDINEQSGASVYDKTKETIFYTLPNKNEVACWKVSDSKKDYDVHSIFHSPGYPFDVKIDENGQIWILSNNMHRFLKADMDSPYTANFFIHYGSTEKIIEESLCNPTIIDKLKRIFSPNDSTTFRPIAFLLFITSSLLSLKHLF